MWQILSPAPRSKLFSRVLMWPVEVASLFESNRANKLRNISSIHVRWWRQYLKYSTLSLSLCEKGQQTCANRIMRLFLLDVINRDLLIFARLECIIVYHLRKVDSGVDSSIFLAPSLSHIFLGFLQTISIFGQVVIVKRVLSNEYIHTKVTIWQGHFFRSKFKTGLYDDRSVL